VSGVELSPDGNKVVFEEWRDYVDHYLFELNFTDPNCPYPCLEMIFESHTGINDNARAPAYNLIGSRVYFEIGSNDTYVHNVAFIEKDLASGSWSDAIITKTYSDGAVRGDLTVGLWDWEFPGDAREVVAFSRNVDGDQVIEILDAENCLTITELCVVFEGIEGIRPSFTSLMSFTGSPPDVLYLFEESTVTGPAILEHNLEGGPVRTVIEVITGGSNRISGVDGAD
jgi:hypothetical protein